MELSQIELNNGGLRPHQVEAKELIFKAWQSYQSVMLQMPTGTGKTYLFTSIIKDIIQAYKAAHKEINILVVAHRMELLDQISEALDKFSIPHGFIQGNREQHLWQRVQVASIMSLLTDKNRNNTQRQKYNFIIVDEAHHSLADTYVELFNLFPNAKKLGVTATPWRLNHESFLRLYQRLIPSRQISWFIQHGLLSDFDYISIKPTSEIQQLVNKTKVAETGDFVNSELNNSFNNMRIRSKLYDSYKKFAYGRKGIIYAINRAHASKIAELYSSHGVVAVAIDYETPKEVRQSFIERFKSGEIKVLVNVDIFTEGFDCPDVSFIQLARPTKSLALYLQQVGRGLRISKGKIKTIILDNVGLYNYFGLPDADRKWQYHFKGQTDIDTIRYYSNSDKNEISMSAEMVDESKFEEDSEQMVVVHGTSNMLTEPLINYQENQIQNRQFSDPIEEFEIGDHYLVRGNMKSFKIYPFIRKRGKGTDGVGNYIYSYDHSDKAIMFNHQPDLNACIIESNTKLNSIICFIAKLLEIDISYILDLDKLSLLIKSPIKQEISLFEFFKLLGML